MSTMTTLAAPVKSKLRKPRKPKVRTIALLSWLPDIDAGMFRVTENGKPETYFCRRLPSDFGTAFEVEKYSMPTADQPGEVVKTYHVNINGDESHCECLGHLRHGHKTICRHVAGLSALMAQGKIPAAAPECRHEHTTYTGDGDALCLECGRSL